MKIQSITYNNFSNRKDKNLKKYNSQESNLRLMNDSFFKNTNLSFRAKTPTALFEEYNWYINMDKIPAIFSFLKINEIPEVMDKFFTLIMESKEESKRLFDSIVSNPREGYHIQKKMSEVLPPNSPNVLRFMFNSPYSRAYDGYIEQKFNEAPKVEELLAIRPDWKGDVLIQKHRQLYGHENLELGKIPDELPRNHLDRIIDYLSQQMMFGLKPKKKIASLDIDGRKYDFAYFVEGRTDKNVFGLFTPEGKKFIIKMNLPGARSLDAPFALGTLAKIDTYLTMNKSRNSAPLRYYNHQKNYLIYDYIEHLHIENLVNNTIISKKIPDYKQLGLNYNDTVGSKNFFLLNDKSNSVMQNTEGFKIGVENEEWISVDDDHVTYNNSLHPSISKWHSPLPNAMQMFF